MFRINLHDNKDYISRYIRTYGFWEKHATELVHQIIQLNRNIVFIDIGANIGYFSLLVASSGIKSIAFEPIKENYELFEQSINENGFQNLIQTYKVALGDERKTSSFNVIKHNMGGSTSIDFLFNLQPDFKRDIEILLADDFLYNIEDDMFIKMDVENMEVEVLNGMLKTLEKGKVKYILMEISKIDKPYLEIFEILKKYKFNIGIHIELLHHFDKSPSRLNISCNYLSIPQIYNSLEQLKEKNILSENISQMNILFIRDML
jgi:FkbM family methyltransferase